jgi:hypothetical protein
VGKWPQALTARRYRAFSDSIALVLHLADLHVIVQEGDELFQAFSHSRMIAPYRWPHRSASWSSAARAAAALTAV